MAVASAPDARTGHKCAICLKSMPMHKKSTAETCSAPCKAQLQRDRHRRLAEAAEAAGLGKDRTPNEILLALLESAGPLSTDRIMAEMGLPRMAVVGLCNRAVGVKLIHKLPDGTYSWAAPQAPATIPLTQAEIDAQINAMNGHLRPTPTRDREAAKLSVILLGGCRSINDGLIEKLRALGIDVAQECISGAPPSTWAKNANALIVLTDMVGHVLSDAAGTEARRRGIPCVRSNHKWSRLRAALDEQWLLKRAAA